MQPQFTLGVEGSWWCARALSFFFGKRRASLPRPPCFTSTPSTPITHAGPRGEEEEEEERRRSRGLQPPSCLAPQEPFGPGDQLVEQPHGRSRGRGGRRRAGRPAGTGCRGRASAPVPVCLVGRVLGVTAGFWSLSLQQGPMGSLPLLLVVGVRHPARCGSTASPAPGPAVDGAGHCCPLGSCVALGAVFLGHALQGEDRPWHGGHCHHGMATTGSCKGWGICTPKPSVPTPQGRPAVAASCEPFGRAPCTQRCSAPFPSLPPSTPVSLLQASPANVPINPASVIKPSRDTTDPGLLVPAWKINHPK